MIDLDEETPWVSTDDNHTHCRLHALTFEKGEVCGPCTLANEYPPRPEDLEVPSYWYRLDEPTLSTPIHTGTGVLFVRYTMGCTYHEAARFTDETMCRECVREDADTPEAA